MIYLVCNEGCGQDFTLLKYGTEAVTDSIDRVGFSCPHCQHVYTAYYSNQLVKSLHKKLTELKQKPQKIKLTPPRLKVLEREVSKLQLELRTEIDRLRKEVEGT